MTRQELVAQIFSKQTYLCVGLDTDSTKIPKKLQESTDGLIEFNRKIVDSTRDHCVAYKINTAFYEALGSRGWEVMEQTVRYIPDTHFRIADAKRGDIGNTAAQYAKAFFETLPFDAITVAPYMGSDSVKPFMQHQDKWTILLGLTSNPGASDFEMLPTDQGLLYERVLQTAMTWGENLMFVVGATQGDQFSRIRQLAPDHFFLVPGVGFQGGSLKDISERAMTKDCGILVNVSRAIIYASENDDFASEAKVVARQYHEEMKQYLKR